MYSTLQFQECGRWKFSCRGSEILNNKQKNKPKTTLHTATQAQLQLEYSVFSELAFHSTSECRLALICTQHKTYATVEVLKIVRMLTSYISSLSTCNLRVWTPFFCKFKAFIFSPSTIHYYFFFSFDQGPPTRLMMARCCCLYQRQAVHLCSNSWFSQSMLISNKVMISRCMDMSKEHFWKDRNPRVDVRISLLTQNNPRMWTLMLNLQPPCDGAPAPFVGQLLVPGLPVRECWWVENV